MGTGLRRPEASGSPSSIFCSVMPATLPLLVAGDLRRVDEELEYDALPPWHGALPPPARASRPRCGGTPRTRPSAPSRFAQRAAVHRDVAAADDRELVVAQHRRVGFGELVALHQIDTRQKLVGRVDAVEVLARDSHEARKPRARADEYRFDSPCSFKVVDGQHAADHHVGLDLDAHGNERVDLPAAPVLFGRRNSGMPYTSTPPAMWSASNTVTLTPALARSAAQVSPAGPEPMMAAFLARWPARTLAALAPFFERVVRREALEAADADRLALDAAHAALLALRLLRAYAAADRGQAVGLPDLVVGFGVLALGDQCDMKSGICTVDGAAGLTHGWFLQRRQRSASF